MPSPSRVAEGIRQGKVGVLSWQDDRGAPSLDQPGLPQTAGLHTASLRWDGGRVHTYFA